MPGQNQRLEMSCVVHHLDDDANRPGVGTDIFVGEDLASVPESFWAHVVAGRPLRGTVVFLALAIDGAAHLPDRDRVELLQHVHGAGRHFLHVTMRFGYRDDIDVPLALAAAIAHGRLPDALIDTRYFCVDAPLAGHGHRQPDGWILRIARALFGNPVGTLEFWRLPANATVQYCAPTAR